MAIRAARIATWGCSSRQSFGF